MFLATILKKIGLVDEERVPRSGREKYEWEILEIRKESVGNSWRLTEKKNKPKAIDNSWRKREEEKQTFRKKKSNLKLKFRGK